MNKSKQNPFIEYMQKGSPGVKAFKANRIINADSLFAVVNKRKADYELSRNVLEGISSKAKRVRANYSALKYWYPNANSPQFTLFTEDLIRAELQPLKELLLEQKSLQIWTEFRV